MSPKLVSNNFLDDQEKALLDTKFPAHVIDEANNLFLEKLGTGKKDVLGKPYVPNLLEIRNGNEEWEFDSLEEFLSEYRESESYHFLHKRDGDNLEIVSG